MLPFIIVFFLEKFETKFIFTAIYSSMWLGQFASLLPLLFLDQTYLFDLNTDCGCGELYDQYSKIDFVSSSHLLRFFLFSSYYFTFFIVVSLTIIKSKKIKFKDVIINSTIDYTKAFYISITIPIFVLLCLIYSSDSFLWLTDPRSAHLLFRSGSGHFYALYIMTFTMSFFFISKMKKYSLRVLGYFLILLYSYTTGSKGIIYGNVFSISIIEMAIIEHKNINIKKILSIFIVIVMFALAFIFYNFYNGINIKVETPVERLFEYFGEWIILQEVVFSKIINEEIPFLYGSNYVSSFWQYVPRIIYPEKPFLWGPTIVTDIILPDYFIVNGGTKSFGFLSYEFIDFGVFAPLMYFLLEFRVLFPLLFCIFFIKVIKYNNLFGFFVFNFIVVYYFAPYLTLLYTLLILYGYWKMMSYFFIEKDFDK